MIFYKTVDAEVAVEVEISEFGEDELLDEAKRRNLMLGEVVVQQLHDAFILNDRAKLDLILKKMFYETLGRIV